MAINDFYFSSKEWDYPMGHTSFVGKSSGLINLSAGEAGFRKSFLWRDPDGHVMQLIEK
ncbi:MAG TPA: hypothetical protein VFD58_17080 [Blastocatellia bacterium]|nr:hypothetical protein [Blastocatellia bacterium]